MSPSGAHCLARGAGSPVDYYDNKFHIEVNLSVNHRFVSNAFTVMESFHFSCVIFQKSLNPFLDVAGAGYADIPPRLFLLSAA